MKAIVLKEFPYIVKDEVGSSDATTFKLRTLTGMQRIYLGGIVSNNADNSNAELTKYILTKGLIGWSNLLDESGRDVKFSKDMNLNLSRLSDSVLTELTEEISSKTMLSDDEIKN